MKGEKNNRKTEEGIENWEVEKETVPRTKCRLVFKRPGENAGGVSPSFGSRRKNEKVKR